MLLLGAVTALLVTAALAGGIWGWWLAGHRARQAHRYGLEAQVALWRHPAGRGRWPAPDRLAAPAREDGPVSGRTVGPDDDPEFLRALERLIRGDDHGGA